MEVDDLDNLIADSLAGVSSALDGDRKAAAQPHNAEAAAQSAGEAVRELHQGPGRSGGDAQEEFLSNLLKKFESEPFQKSVADALQLPGDPATAAGSAVEVSGDSSSKEADPAAAEPGRALRPGDMVQLKGLSKADLNGQKGTLMQAAPGDVTPGRFAVKLDADGREVSIKAENLEFIGIKDAPALAKRAEGVEDFLQEFLKSFESAVGSDDGFANSMNSLMTSMLNNNLITEPLRQIADALEPWLKSQKGLASSDRSRYEAQLRLYRTIIEVYQKSPDPLPEDRREEVQRLLTELHSHGQPPEEVMKQVQPKEAEDAEGTFEDFVKSMGLSEGLGAAEQELLKKLTEDPEELTKVMKEMTGKLDMDGQDEACKQQ